MSSTIAFGIKSGRRVTLDEVYAGEKGITCYTCGTPLCCKDGKGKHADSENRSGRSVAKGKHFAHTKRSKCYGEGPAHYILKEVIAGALNECVKLSAQGKLSNRPAIGYSCPSPAYGVHCFNFAPNPFLSTRSMLGTHRFELLTNLAVVKTEHTLGEGATRPDIVGLDSSSNALWIIEIYRKHPTSKHCLLYANSNNIPVFQVNIDSIPVRYAKDDPFSELYSSEFWIKAENAERGFLFADKSWNTTCEREDFGMPADSRCWSKVYAPTEDGAEVLLHECGEMVCPDSHYIFTNKISVEEMYLDPQHRQYSHTIGTDSKQPSLILESRS